MGRVLLGGLVGGLVLFVWGFVSHAVLELTEKTFQQVPNEAKVAAAVSENIKEAGVYYSPWMDPADHDDEAKKKAWDEAYKKGPYFFLVRGHDGDEMSMPRMMGMEFATNFLAALIASMVVAALGARCNAMNKVLLVGLLGLFVWLNQSASYAIWYGFPKSLVTAELIDLVVQWFLAAIAIVMIVRPPKTT